MSSTLQGKTDSPKRLVSDEEALVIPENARPTDESPTVISKTPPLVQPAQSSSQQKIVDLARKHATPESIVASLRGRRLAHYELIEPIGVGGMAAVIRARDTLLDRFVALKILPPEMAHEPENVQRFHQEAKAAAKLDHENIARAFFCGEDQGLHFIAFEFVEGITLRAMMDQRGRLPVAEAVRYILQIAAGLEHAATRGVVHRDVKPSNVIITPAGRAKLVDMGLARNLERHGDDLTQSGVTLGTFDYISPEQALEPRDADTRSDIYSLGCTFYHLLTGQPPVPEGTPAKKLQHHQHGQPLDPRAIDPAIPDEIVMILGKMMAKNPKDRYQRPIHLLHHLMQVAQKVGAAADIPEGVLLVDAPLPSQPHHRPFLLIGMSLAALVAVTLLLSLAPEPIRQPNNKGEVKADGNKDSGLLAKKKDQAPVKNGAAGAELPSVVKKTSDLQALFGDRQSREINAGIEGKFDLDQAGGLTFEGSAEQRLVLQSNVAGNYATLRHHYQNNSAPFGLTLDGGREVVFRRCKFQVDSDTTPDMPAAAVAIRGGARHVKFEQCIFTQANDQTMAPDRIPLASVLIDASDSLVNARPVVTFERCLFEGLNANVGGQAAVAINGPATVNMINCAFKSHGAFLHFRGNSTLNNTSVNLQNCAGFVVLGPALRFDANTAAQVQVSRSVFARPDSSLAPQNGLPEPNLVFLAEGATVKFDGEQNLYYNLNAMIGRKAGPLIATTEDYQKFLGQTYGADKNSRYPRETAENPWQNPNGPDELAFQLKADYHGKLGLLTSWRGSMPEPPQLLATKQPAPKKTIVDATDNTGGMFKTLNGALSEAKDGDTIYIRHGDDRDVIVPLILLRPGIVVTLKADKTDDFEFRPRLILNKKFKDNVASFFKIQEGKLEIEGLEIVLDPDKDRDVAQSIVQMGGAHCIFKNCVFTMRAANGENLSVVSSIDLDTMMKDMAAPPSAGKVEFHDCFVRGTGDLVALNGCRLLHVEMENSLVALDGSLLDIKAAAKPMPMNQGVYWKMKRSSIFTTDSVFALRYKFGDVLTETNADVESCLLGSLRPGKSVVNLEGDLDIREKLKWKGERNFYADFDKPNEWRDKFETKSELGALTLPKLTDKNLQTLWDAMPDWFKPADAEQERVILGFGQSAEAEKRSLQSLTEPDEP
jgi:serine/threonine protein kinase